MMIMPAFTSWPPYFFTPSRFDSESRPFREEAAPFLCAIALLLLFFLSRPAGQLYVRDLDRGVALTVARVAPVAGLAAVFVNLDLRAFTLADHLGEHAGLRELRPARARLALVIDDQERRELEGLVGPLHALYLDDIALGDLVLLSARADDCVHVSPNEGMPPG